MNAARAAMGDLNTVKLLIVGELGYVPFTAVGSELLFEVFSQRYERGATLVTSNLPFDEWTSIFGSERLPVLCSYRGGAWLGDLDSNQD